MSQEPLICVRCGRPVEVFREDYQRFERMHWLCFHLEFEHDADPDAPCGDPSCPQWHIQIYRQKLQQLGVNPEDVVSQAIMGKLQTAASTKNSAIP